MHALGLDPCVCVNQDRSFLKGRGGGGDIGGCMYNMYTCKPTPTHLVGVEIGEERGHRGPVLLLGGVEGGGDGALDDLVVEVGAGQFCVFWGWVVWACCLEGLKGGEVWKSL